MEKQQKPAGGVCEKLFHALNINPTLKPLRRLTFRNQDPNTAISSPPPLPDHPSNPATKPTEPAAKTTAKKAQDAAANLKADLKMAKDKIVSSVPQRPKVDPAPASQQPPLAAAKVAAAKPKKELNQKVDDFIKRTKGKLRTGSGIGKAPPS